MNSIEAYEICQPCINAAREFGIFEWFITFLVMLFTIISLISRMNIFYLLKSVGQAVERALNPNSKKIPPTKEIVTIEGDINAVTTETQTGPSATPSTDKPL